MNGFNKFNPFRYESGPPNAFNPFNDGIEQVTKKINDEIARIQEWGTLMNIFSFNGWKDPLTGDLHIVVKAGKLLTAKHIGEAAEIVLAAERANVPKEE